MKKILIVEDQAEIRELVRVTLEFEDYDIHEAGDGHAGLAAALAIQPELVLLDVMMPGGIDGIELCRRIRAEPTLRRTKIVMLSARSQAADKVTGLTAGADDYLIKPFSPLELMKVIMRVLR